MKRTLLNAGLLLVVTGCQGLPAGVPTDPAERIQAGDRVKVQRVLTVPAHQASVILQNGRVTGGAPVDRFSASCRFVMQKIKDEPQTIQAAEFIVTQVSYWEEFIAPDYRLSLSGSEFINFEITARLHFEQQPAVHSLVCRHDDEHDYGRHLTRSEMQHALGEFATIIKASKP